MGQDQSKGGNSSSGHHQHQQANNNHISNLVTQVPYTSFSLPKTADPQLDVITTTTSTTTPTTPASASSSSSLHNTSGEEVDGIVTVNTLSGSSQHKLQQQHQQQQQQQAAALRTDIFGNVLPSSSSSSDYQQQDSATTGGQEDDEGESVLEQLNDLPQFYPLIKSSVEATGATGSTASSFLPLPSILFSSSNEGSSAYIDNNLDRVDDKPLVDICAEFQTYSMQQARSICIRQDAVFNRLQESELESARLVKDLSMKNEQLKKLNGALRDAERLNRFVVQCNQNVLDVVNRLDQLEQMLPYAVKTKISTPLFQKQYVDTTNSSGSSGQ